MQLIYTVDPKTSTLLSILGEWQQHYWLWLMHQVYSKRTTTTHSSNVHGGLYKIRINTEPCSADGEQVQDGQWREQYHVSGTEQAFGVKLKNYLFSATE